MDLNTLMADYASPTIFHIGKGGATYQWRCWTEGNEIFTEYGQVGGQLQTTPGKKCVAKNVGRANATTAQEQAVLEARAMCKFKLDRKYSETIEACKISRIAPMLAKSESFTDYIDKKTGKLKKGTRRYVTYPCDVQPKLDGNRCMAFWEGDRIVLLSRGLQEIDLPHLVDELKTVLSKGDMWDGELYTHGYSCQQMTTLIKGTPMDQAKVHYHVYDIPVCDGEDDRPWSQRRLDLDRLVAESNPETPHIFRVPTFTVYDEEEIMMCVEKFLDAKYEGGIVRLHQGVYEPDGRSKYLLKVKLFEDHEFVIIGFTDGKGKNEGTVKWTCRMENGLEFDCAPTGNEQDRKQMFLEGEQHIGKLLKVKHFGYYDSGKPRHPVGIGFREDFDIPRSGKKKK